MRFRQDLCIALILTVVGTGLTGTPQGRPEAEEELGVIDDAMAADGLSETEIKSVRRLIARARDHERAGDEDGALQAMAEAYDVLKLS